jgi:CubicO group peptidase (beta-lactamase class C family)
VRQLLSHSAGLPLEETPEFLAGKSNLQLIAGSRGKPLLFPAGSAFSYCNLCTTALAEIVERVSGTSYLDFARARLDLPGGVGLRPARLADWTGRAIGFRRRPDGELERFDSWEGERFYGPGNLSVSAAQLASWGVRWWRHPDRPKGTTKAALIAGKASGLTLGNWNCAPVRRRCHYLGHHEGFHHMLYWDADRKQSIAMVSNNAVEPGLQQRLQRAIVAFSEGRAEDGKREAAIRLSGATPPRGRYRLGSGETVEIRSIAGRLAVRRRGIDYPAYQIGSGIRYVPGLDLYFAIANRRLQWLTLYEDQVGTRIS